MTQTETKKRYTLREVQVIATTYDLLLQPLNTRTYGIFFEGQLVAEVKKLVDAIAIFPDLYRAIQEQLAEQEAAIAPAIEEAIALTPSSPHLPISPSPQSVIFSHHAYEDSANWELRQELNSRGYQDAMQRKDPAFREGPYMAGYERGVRDRWVPPKA